MKWQDIAGAVVSVGAGKLGGLLGGPLGGAIGAQLGQEIASRLGVPADPEHVVEAIERDPQMAERQLSDLEHERAQHLDALQIAALGHQLEMARMDRENGFFSWGWRPALMWMIGYLWLHNIVVAPVLLNAVLGYAIPLAPFESLMALTGLISMFYMGGHTLKETVKTWKGAR